MSEQDDLIKRIKETYKHLKELRRQLNKLEW